MFSPGASTSTGSMAPVLLSVLIASTTAGAIVAMVGRCKNFPTGSATPSIDLDAFLQLERGERIEPQLLQGALELDRRRLDLEHRRNLAPQIIRDDVLPLPVRRGDNARSHVLVGTTRAVQ